MANESGWTNRGMYRMLNYFFRGAALPANFYVALVTNATAPSWDTNTLGELTQIVAGNGYTSGGYALTPGETDFPTLTEDDDARYAEIVLKGFAWSAAGGSIPASGSGATYAVLTTYHATVGSREVMYYWYLGGARSVSSGNTLSMADLTARIRLPAGTYSSGWTTRGLSRLLGYVFQGDAHPDNFYLPMVTAANVPSHSTNTLGQLTEIEDDNGYTGGGYALIPNATDFPTLTENDADDLALVTMKPIAWTATGGSIPSSGSGASYAALTDDNATPGTRDVLHFWSLINARTIAVGQAITLPGLTLTLRKPV